MFLSPKLSSTREWKLLVSNCDSKFLLQLVEFLKGKS